MKNNNYKNPSLKYIQENYEKEFAPTFQRIIKNWNVLIRNFLTKFVGVSLNDSDETNRRSIPISIEPVYKDADITDLIERDLPFFDFEEYNKLKKLIDAAEQSKEYYRKPPEKDHLESVIGYGKSKINKIDIDAITKLIFDFKKHPNTDIFGSYFIRECKIEIYVYPIVLFSQLHGLNMESFATSILAHELAHGYTHIGYDKDGQFWENFSETEDLLAEGLAQYFTEKFIEKYHNRDYRMKECFEYLLRYQSEPYSIHKTWDATYEQVFSAFIETRRVKNNSYLKFSKMLKESKLRIKSMPRNSLFD